MALFDNPHELGGVQQRFVRTRIQPGSTAPQKLYVELSTIKISLVEISDLQLTPCRRLDLLGKLYDAVIVEVKPRNSEFRFWLFRLFLDR